jgi:hypothetical protein
MISQLKYIELATGSNHNGPAWIGKVEFSKSGKTMYFNGHAFKGNGHGYCFDIETRNTYWISGVKKNGQDRHWAGNGKIMIDKNVVEEYLKLRGLEKLDLKKYIIVDDIIETDKIRFKDIENENYNTIQSVDKYESLNDYSFSELETLLSEIKRKESYTNNNNGKKFITIKRMEIEKRLEELK